MFVVSLSLCPSLEGNFSKIENFVAICQKGQFLFLAACELYQNSMHCFEGKGYCRAFLTLDPRIYKIYISTLLLT